MSLLRSITTVALILALAGCSQPPPPNLPTVHKVTGKVVTAAGAPAESGLVQFESLATPGKVGLGELAPDGTFSVVLMAEGQKLEGTVIGPQRVTYIPKMTQDQSGAPPVTLTETFEVKDGLNDFTIKLP
jgi:hypothetical protein